MPCLAHLRPRSWSAGSSQGGICDEPIAAAGACVNVHPSIRAKARPAWTGLALFPLRATNNEGGLPDVRCHRPRPRQKKIVGRGDMLASRRPSSRLCPLSHHVMHGRPQSAGRDRPAARRSLGDKRGAHLRQCRRPYAPVMTDRNVMRPGRPQIRPRHSRRREPSQGGCRSLRACLPLVPGMFALWLPLA